MPTFFARDPNSEFMQRINSTYRTKLVEKFNEEQIVARPKNIDIHDRENFVATSSHDIRFLVAKRIDGLIKKFLKVNPGVEFDANKNQIADEIATKLAEMPLKIVASNDLYTERDAVTRLGAIAFVTVTPLIVMGLKGYKKFQKNNNTAVPDCGPFEIEQTVKNALENHIGLNANYAMFIPKNESRVIDGYCFNNSFIESLVMLVGKKFQEKHKAAEHVADNTENTPYIVHLSVVWRIQNAVCHFFQHHPDYPMNLITLENMAERISTQLVALPLKEPSVRDRISQGGYSHDQRSIPGNARIPQGATPRLIQECLTNLLQPVVMELIAAPSVVDSLAQVTQEGWGSKTVNNDKSILPEQTYGM